MRESPRAFFGVDSFPVRQDLKPSAIAGHELGRQAVFFFKFCCQPDSFGFVVSHVSVKYFDLHSLPPIGNA